MTAESALTPSFLVGAQQTLLVSVLNCLVPVAGDFPGAGDLGVASYVDRVVGQSTELKRLFAQGLTQIVIVSHEQYAQAFTDLSTAQQDTVLQQVEATAPAFFEALVTQAYSGYYIHPTVLQHLGTTMQPPQPRGHLLEPLDPSLLDKVKQRPPCYRQT